MLPSAVFPLHDPEEIFFPHLEIITPVLKSTFSNALISVTPITGKSHPERVERLGEDPFFRVFPLPSDYPVGDHFCYLYRQAVEASQPQQLLHLCFVDRLAFILQSRHRDPFTADVLNTRDSPVPILYQRSPAAWATHPRNYQEIEGFATTLGELIFEKWLDFTWCHLAIPALLLGEVLPTVRNHDLSVLAEIVLGVRDTVRTVDVDWLAWEDPFILGREAEDLKSEREASVAETEKRLGYVIPTVQRLVETARIISNR